MPTHKRCLECGNVFHFKLSFCTSCCRPVTDVTTWVPATAPTPGERRSGEENQEGTDGTTEGSEEETDSGSLGLKDEDRSDSDADTHTEDETDIESGEDEDEDATSEEDERPIPTGRWNTGANRAVTDAFFS
jgi:hypothetical protein